MFQNTKLFYILNDIGNEFTNYKGLCGDPPRITGCGNRLKTYKLLDVIIPYIIETINLVLSFGEAHQVICDKSSYLTRKQITH